MSSASPVRLLVIDDQEVVRAGIRAMLAGTEVEIAVEAERPEEAAQQLRDRQVDVVLVDPRASQGDVLQSLRQAVPHNRPLPVLIFSDADHPAYAARALALGACGFLQKSCTRDELLAAVRAAAAGESYWPRREMRRISVGLLAPSAAADAGAPLSRRETEVLKLLTNGSTNQQIAADLKLSVETIKEHVQNILRKIGVRDRTQAAVWAVRHGLAE